MTVKNVGDNALIVILFVILSILSSAGPLDAAGPCPPLPPPSGTIVSVDSEQTLLNAVNNATPGTTILITDGTYHLGAGGNYLWIDTPNLTLRSASGQRSSVILDDKYSATEIITVAASNVTIADLTITRAGSHLIHVVSSNRGDTLNTLIYNVHLIDPGEHAIKINPHEERVYYPDDGVVACSTLELTAVGRAKVLEINGSCYTGGVDAHRSRGWTVRDNVIKGFWCAQYLAEHGIHFWTGSRDTVVERNFLINNARGIGFGLRINDNGRVYADDPCPAAVGDVGHFGGMIRNNFVFASDTALFASQYGADCGIALAQSCGAQVMHNTVAFIQPPFSGIEWRFTNTDADVVNNLVTHNLMDRGGVANLFNNLSGQALTLFKDGPGGDLHLAADADVAIDKAIDVSAGLCDDDFDGQLRPMGIAADIGADEYPNGQVNTAPLVNDQWITTEENAVNVPIVFAGSDADSDPLTFIVVTGPVNGFLSGTAPNLYYTPRANYRGSDTILFKANDGAADSAEATVYITINPASNTAQDGAGGGSGCFLDTLFLKSDEQDNL